MIFTFFVAWVVLLVSTFVVGELFQTFSAVLNYFLLFRYQIISDSRNTLSEQLYLHDLVFCKNLTINIEQLLNLKTL